MDKRKLVEIVLDSMVAGYAGEKAKTFDPAKHILGPSPRKEIRPHILRMIREYRNNPEFEIEFPEFEQNPTVDKYVAELYKRISDKEGREGREVDFR